MELGSKFSPCYGRIKPVGSKGLQSEVGCGQSIILSNDTHSVASIYRRITF